MNAQQDTILHPGIVSNPHRMGGRPTIAGTRITVERILSMLAGSYTVDDILRAYPHLTRDQISAALEYAGEIVHQHALAGVGSGTQPQRGDDPLDQAFP